MDTSDVKEKTVKYELPFELIGAWIHLLDI